LRASLVSDSTKFDTLSLITRVPGLVLLPVENTSYSKTGGTCNHHGPRIDNLYQHCRTPDNNHWVNQVARDSLVSAARAFKNAEWNTSGELMKINDISLPLGGGFDIYAGWERDVDRGTCANYGHCLHREGLDVDIENLSRLRQLREVLENRGWSWLDESNLPSGATRYPHFQFY